MKHVFTSHKGLITEDVPIPIPSDKEILVKVKYSLVSTGTETTGLKSVEKSLFEKIDEKLKLVEKVSKKLSSDGFEKTYNVSWNRIKGTMSPQEKSLFLKPLGYSNSGIIVALGRAVSNFNVGDRVACAGSGNASHAEFVTIPVNLAALIPDTVLFEDASFTTVGSIAMQGIRRANVNPGETIVITGLGLLGLLAVQIAKAWGLNVIGLDLMENRLDLAKSLGADVCFNASDKEVERKIMEYTYNVGADAVIIYAATKSSEPANQAMRVCRMKGRVVAVGGVGMNLDRDPMYYKELDFVISTSYGPGRYDKNYELKGNDYPIGYVRWTENRNMQEFIRLLNENKITTECLITKTYPIEDAVEAYQTLVQSPKENITVLFSYPDESPKKERGSKLDLTTKQPVTKDKINVGVIGAGRFVSKFLLPSIKKLDDLYNLVALSTKTPGSAKVAEINFKPKYITNDYQEILNDNAIDMVLIGTKDLHAKLVIEALKAKKHVFVEKPLAMNNEELEEIKKVLESQKCFLTVGFNRRYSPLSIKVKEILDKIKSPIYINYRVNAGYIPNQDLADSGGRIIGECCHFLDLFNYLIDSAVKNIDAQFIPVDNKLITSWDNAAITVSYDNGSIAHLSYISIGAEEGLSKERIEIFQNRSAMIIDDFKKLMMYDNGEKDIELKNIDKGWFKEIEEFGKLLKGQKSLIMPIEQAFLATEETFEIQERTRK
jgi:predicted dehydrogenase/threonine dehydrogenase-like Zn-dependent dehydrogenase